MGTRRFLPYPFHKQRFYEGSFLRGLGSGSGSGLECLRYKTYDGPLRSSRSFIFWLHVRTSTISTCTRRVLCARTDVRMWKMTCTRQPHLRTHVEFYVHTWSSTCKR